MYVGKKDRSPGAGVLERNGLDNGDALRARADGPGANERGRRSRAARSRASGSRSRTPDLTRRSSRRRATPPARSASSAPRTARSTERNRDEFFFVTTGRAPRATRSAACTRCGSTRTTRPRPATLTLVYNADAIDRGRRRHRHQPRQHRRERRLPDDQRGRHRRRAAPVMADARAATARSGASTSTGESASTSSRRPCRRARPARSRRDARSAGTWETSGIINASGLLRGRYLALRRPGPPADDGARRQHRRGRPAAAPETHWRLARQSNYPLPVSRRRWTLGHHPVTAPAPTGRGHGATVGRMSTVSPPGNDAGQPSQRSQRVCRVGLGCPTDRHPAPGREGRAQTVTARSLRDRGLRPLPVTAEPAKAGLLRDSVCAGCGYGVAVKTPPPACPMCRGVAWLVRGPAA